MQLSMMNQMVMELLMMKQREKWYGKDYFNPILYKGKEEVKYDPLLPQSPLFSVFFFLFQPQTWNFVTFIFILWDIFSKFFRM